MSRAIKLARVTHIEIEPSYEGDSMKITVYGRGMAGAEYEVSFSLGASFIGYLGRQMHKVLDVRKRFTESLRARLRGE